MTDSAMPPDADLLAWVDRASRGTLIERVGIEFVHVGPEEISARMPVAGNTQPYGLLHGGATVVLAETLGSVAAAIHAGPERATVGIEVNATHHRAVRAGWVTGTTRIVHAGKTMCTVEIVVADESGGRVCTSRLTCLIRERPPAQVEAGRTSWG
ncbi:MAG: hotdog fold thioesterase [Tetrasphaera sp.]